MFSAVYLVCFMGEPCKFFVDDFNYSSLLECEEGAEENIARNNKLILDMGQNLPKVEYQCLNWEKA